MRTVVGHSRPDGKGHIATDIWLELPGASHFVTLADDCPDVESASTGLAFLTAGVVFCFMTQWSRYIEPMKLDINGVRMVQTGSFSTAMADGHLHGKADPVHTHLFLNVRADEDTHETLMRIAARTCYLHASLAETSEPVITLEPA